MTPTDLSSLLSMISAGESSRWLLQQEGQRVIDAAEVALEMHEGFKTLFAERQGAAKHFTPSFERLASIFCLPGYLEGVNLDNSEVAPGDIGLSICERGYCGDGDSHHTIPIPQEWLTMEPEVLAATFDTMLTTFVSEERAREVAAKEKAIQTKRAQLAALQAELGTE